jgi:hypothetical protein
VIIDRVREVLDELPASWVVVQVMCHQAGVFRGIGRAASPHREVM